MRRGRELAVPAALALVQLVLLTVTAWDKADTPDEPRYVGGAIVQWARLDFDSWPHCPVPKWGFGLALRLVEPWIADTPAKAWRDAAHIHLYKHPLPRLRRNLMAARSATILVTVFAGLWLWATAARVGLGAAAAAQALWCFSPTVLAHGSLATLDAWVGASTALTLLATARALERASGLRWFSVGVALGLGLGTKIVAAVFVPAAIAALAYGLVLGRPERPLLGIAKMVGLVVLGVFLSLWAAHGFDVGLADTREVAQQLGGPALSVQPVPFPSWWEGLHRQLAVGAGSRRNYLFGEMSKEGWWWYYLAVLALKLAIGAQLLGALRLGDMLTRLRSRSLALDLGLLAPCLALFVAFSMSDNQTGARYLLPAFPAVMLWAARLFVSHRPRWLRLSALLALALGAGESLAVHPHHLMFFNGWAGGPKGGPRYLVTGDDWGQDQRRLAEWQRRKGFAGIFYTLYPDNPRVWGLRFKPAPCEPRTGVFALHATETHRPKRVDPGCYDWLTLEPPDERIGYSIYVYYVNRERLERLRRERGRVEPFYQGGEAPG